MLIRLLSINDLVFQLTWYDEQNNIINDVKSYQTKKMEGKKLFEAISELLITPTRELHITTFR